MHESTYDPFRFFRYLARFLLFITFFLGLRACYLVYTQGTAPATMTIGGETAVVQIID